jgi:hypothetical protein
VSVSLVAPATGLARLWRRLDHPVDPLASADVLIGLPPANAQHLLAVSLAASPEADALLDGIPNVLRSLAVSTTSVPVRCDGELRGPVLWSATMAARSASPGAGNVFVCASPVKAYDTPENQVLVAALARIVRAAKVAETPVEGPHAPPAYDVRRARHNGERAREALAHRALQTVRRVPIDGRMVHKARTGTKAAVFRNAVDLVARSWAEVGADDLAAFVDEDTRAEHVLAADVLDVLTSRGRVHERLRLVDSAAVSGPFAYAHHAGVVVDGRRVSSLSEL